MKIAMGVVCCALALSMPAMGQQAGQSAASAATPAAAQSATAAQTDQGAPADPITVTQADELMQLTGVNQQLRRVMKDMMPLMKQALPPYMPEDVLEDFRKRVGGPEVDALIVRAYQAHISTKDAAAAIAFYKSPAGQRILAAQPLVLQDIHESAGALGRKLMLEVVQQHMQEIQAAKQRYELQHPWSVPKN